MFAFYATLHTFRKFITNFYAILHVMVGFPAFRKEFFVWTRWMEIEEYTCFWCHRSA